MKRILYRKSTKKIVVITRIDLLSGLDIYNGILEFADNGNLRWDVRLMQPIDVDITPAVIAKFVSDGIDGILLTFPLAENTIRALSALRDAAHGEGKAVLLVSHDSEAARYADVLLRMDGGALTRQEG